MLAPYKLAIIALLAVMAVIFAPLANAGGLNRIAVTGPSGVGNGSDPNGPWLPENLGSKIQIGGEQLEFGTEIMVPKFTYQSCWGKWESKNVVHPLPYLSYGKRLDENTVYGIEIKTEYGLGASFQKIYGTMDTRSLISGTYIEPYVAHRLSDEWSIGLGLIIADTMLTWHGPLDANRNYLPIDTDTKAIGYGIGGEVGLFYQPTEQLAFGIDYTSGIKADLYGRTEIQRPPHIRDKVKTSFEFPDKLEVSGAWKATDRWLVVADWTWYGYSENSLESVDIKFKKLFITKPVDTNWADNYAMRIGSSYKINDRWTIGGGLSYMSKAIPDKTMDFMTPDVDGYAVAARVKCKVNEYFDLTAGVSHGWGSNEARGAKMTADITTFSLVGCIKF